MNATSAPATLRDWAVETARLLRLPEGALGTYYRRLRQTWRAQDYARETAADFPTGEEGFRQAAARWTAAVSQQVLEDYTDLRDAPPAAEEALLRAARVVWEGN